MHVTSNFQVMLRIYAEDSDLDFSTAKVTLGLTSQNEYVESTFTDDDHEIGVIKFKEASSMRSPGADGSASDGSPHVFLSASEWLSSRTRSQFDELRKMGMNFDLFVQGYMGLVPIRLIHELSRLGLPLWIAPGGLPGGLER